MAPPKKPKKPTQSAAEKEMAEEAYKFAMRARLRGCSLEQVENFVNAGIVLQPKQLEIAALCRQCDAPDGPIEILAGGGRGSGKTNGILAQIFADDCQRVKGLKVLCLRKVGKANKEQIEDFRKKLLMRLKHNYREQKQEILFENGSMVIMGNFLNEADIEKYLGLEYDLIYIMESNQLTASKKVNILSCLRTNKPNWRPRCYQDTNPGGIDHVGNKRKFVDPWKSGTQTNTRYIHSVVDDNKFVNPEYKKFLETLVGWQRMAWLEGSWEFMAGSFFSNFYESVHVYPNQQTDLNTKSIVRWFAGLDYGFSHPTAFTLGCETESGDIFVVGTYSAANTLIEEHAANIFNLLALHNVSIDELEFIAAGRDCFKVDKDGSTVATEYSERGVHLTAVHIDRINAWSQVAEVFGDVSKQIRPRCFIHKNCPDLVVQIQVAQCDPKKPNDILKMNANPEDGSGGDDELESCVSGDTKIIIPNGEIKIKSIFAGDYVLTRNGFKKVLSAGVTKKNAKIKILKLENGTELKITGNHRIWIVGKGWKRLDETWEGCDILLCQTSYCQQLMSESLTESDFIGIQNQNKERLDVISGHPLIIGERGFKCFTKKYGSILMEKLKKAFTSITKTKTRLITTLKIWSVSQAQNTIKSILKNETKHTKSGETKSLEHQDCRCVNPEEQLSENVFNAEFQLQGGTISKKEKHFAGNCALKNGGGEADFTTCRENVRTVQKHLQQTNHQKQSFVPCRVSTITDGGSEDVYNLEVEDCPEYFANGVLVHNCRNMVVMAYSSLITSAKPVQMGSYQSLSSKNPDEDFIDVETVIQESEAADTEMFPI